MAVAGICSKCKAASNSQDSQGCELAQAAGHTTRLRQQRPPLTKQHMCAAIADMPTPHKHPGLMPRFQECTDTAALTASACSWLHW